MFIKGYKQTEQQKIRIGLAHKGKKKKYDVWNKGKKLNDEHRKKLSIAGGHKQTDETRRRISNTLKAKKEQSHLWKGGIYPQIKVLRHCIEYKLWRDSVFRRDKYTCVWCGSKFIKGVTGRVIIHADHIKSFADYPELRFAIDNGRTLCKPCHIKTDNYGYKGRWLKK